MMEERGRTEPFVVRLVESFVYEWNVQPSMYPVDAIIGEEQEAARSLVSLSQCSRAKRDAHKGTKAKK
jgi:hypothetical protein